MRDHETPSDPIDLAAMTADNNTENVIQSARPSAEESAAIEAKIRAFEEAEALKE